MVVLDRGFDLHAVAFDGKMHSEDVSTSRPLSMIRVVGLDFETGFAARRARSGQIGDAQIGSSGAGTIKQWAKDTI